MRQPVDEAVSTRIKALRDLFRDLKIKVGGPGVRISGFAPQWSELTISKSSGIEDTGEEIKVAEPAEAVVDEDLKSEDAARGESPLRKER